MKFKVSPTITCARVKRNRFINCTCNASSSSFYGSDRLIAKPQFGNFPINYFQGWGSISCEFPKNRSFCRLILQITTVKMYTAIIIWRLSWSRWSTQSFDVSFYSSSNHSEENDSTGHVVQLSLLRTRR
jgi:hypothetical protein